MTNLGHLKNNEQLVEHDLGLNLAALVAEFGFASQLFLEPIDEGKAWLTVGPHASDTRQIARVGVFYPRNSAPSVWLRDSDDVQLPVTMFVKQPRIKPTFNAERLFRFFLDKNNYDAIVGDLEECYACVHRKCGKRPADLWYWSQAIRSVGPIIWATVKKRLGLAALVELYRRILR